MYIYIYIYILHHSILKHSDRSSDRSQRTLDIRPAPDKRRFSVGPHEWWEYDHNFLIHSSHS